MSKQAIIGQITARLTQLGMPYQIGQGTDLSVYNEFVDAKWSTGSKKIIYEASILLDEAAQTAFMWEKTTESGSGFSGGFDGGSSFQSGTTLFRKVKCIQYGPDGKAFEVNLDLGAIPKAVKEAAGQYGWKFKTVLSQAKARYAGGFAPAAPEAAPMPASAAENGAVARNAFCGQCGSPLTDTSRFCPACGQPIGQAANASLPAGVYPAAPAFQEPSAKKPRSAFKALMLIAYGFLALLIILLFALLKTSLPGWLIAVPLLGLSLALQLTVIKKGWVTGFVVFVITTAVLLGVFLFTTDTSDLDKDDPKNTTSQSAKPSPSAATTQTDGQTKTSTAVNEKSSIVSLGVNLDDLGNIINGQYFFDDGQNQFYSSFDQNSAAHIYRTIKSTQKTSQIFDGFGWSLVVHDGWLYFSGNAGTVIDGTYNLFRMQLDGSGLEKINDGYCYGMSIYKNWLYYITKTSHESSDYKICRSSLDGSSQEELVTDFNGFCVIHENFLYYSSKDGTFYKAVPDGSSPVVLLDEKVRYVIIGNGKLIYVDASGNIKVAGIDGKDSKLVRAAGSLPVYSLNSAKDKLFYTVYDPAGVSGRYAYAYDLYQVNMDGSGNTKIYSEVSCGTFINVVKDKVFTLDYAIDLSTGQMPAIARSMDFSGSNVTNLPR
jgi:hypothetical protein